MSLERTHDLGQEQDASGEGVKFPSSYLAAKLEALREAIKEVEEEIHSRQVLSQAFLKETEEESKQIRSLVSELGAPWSKGYLPAMEELRIKLTRELFNLSNRVRSERLRMWDDIVSLKKQRRDFLMEYQSLKRTLELLEMPQGGEDP